MSHIRTDIRNAVKVLLEALPGMAGKVYVSRMIPVPQAALPAYCIYTMEESSELHGTGRALVRELSLTIEAIVSGLVNHDSVADAHAVLIESAIGANRTLGGLAYDCILTSTRLGLAGDGEQKNGTCVMTYRVTYRTAVHNPEITNP